MSPAVMFAFDTSNGEAESRSPEPQKPLALTQVYIWRNPWSVACRVRRR